MAAVAECGDDWGEAPIDNCIEWAKDARDSYFEAGEGDAARLVAAALLLLTRARVATLGAVTDLASAG